MFIFRVIAQFIQITFPMGWMPPFEQWQGSSLPYPALLASQLLIVLTVVIVIGRIRTGELKPETRLGRFLYALGGVYFIVMLLRLVLGLTLLSSVPWFEKLIPAFFHLVLASIVLLIGHYHSEPGHRLRSP